MVGSTSNDNIELLTNYASVPYDDLEMLNYDINSGPSFCIVGAGDGRMAFAAEQLGFPIDSLEWTPHSYFLQLSLDKTCIYDENYYINLIKSRAMELLDSVHDHGLTSWISVAESLNAQDYETNDVGVRIQIVLASLLVELVHRTHRPTHIELDAISRAFRNTERGLWRRIIDGYCEFITADSHGLYSPMSVKPLVVNGHECAHAATCVDLDNKDILIDMRMPRRGFSPAQYRKDLELYKIVLDGVNVSHDEGIILGVHTDVFESNSFRRSLDLQISRHSPSNDVPDIDVSGQFRNDLNTLPQTNAKRYWKKYRRLVSQWCLSDNKQTKWSLHFCKTNSMYMRPLQLPEESDWLGPGCTSETPLQVYDLLHTRALFDAAGFCYQTPDTIQYSQMIFSLFCEIDDSSDWNETDWNETDWNEIVFWCTDQMLGVWYQPYMLEDFGCQGGDAALIRQYLSKGKSAYLVEPDSVQYFWDHPSVSELQYDIDREKWHVEIEEPIFLIDAGTTPQNLTTYWERIWLLIYSLESPDSEVVNLFETHQGFPEAVSLLRLWGENTYQHIPKLAVLLAGRRDNFSQRFMLVVDQWKFLIEKHVTRPH